MIETLAVDPLQLIPLAVLGAVLGLDVVSFPQAMISRPIVAATLAGALLGHPERGLLMGVCLEFFALESLPFGASRYPEWGSASVVGGSLFAMTPDNVPAAMTVSALAALVTASVGGNSMVWMRRFLARVAKHYQGALNEGSGRAIIGLQLAGMTCDLLRGFAVAFGGLLVFVPVRTLVLATFTFPGTLSRAFVVGVASAVGLAAVWKVVRMTPGARWWLLGGLAVGFVIAGGIA